MILQYSVCCLHIKPFFLLNISTPSVRADYFILEKYKCRGQTVRQKKNITAIYQGKASEMLAYLVREHSKTSQTIKRKISLVLLYNTRASV